MDDRLDALSPAHVSDALTQIRLGGGAVSGWLAAFAGTFAGFALPVQCVWEDYRMVESADYRTTEIEAAVGQRTVVVIDGGGRPDAVFGPVAAAAYASRGASAVVVNGGSRDRTDLAGALAVLTRHRVHRSGFGRVRRELTDRVIIDGVEIRRGDLIVGDPSGIVIVPADAVSAIVDRAVAIAAADADIVAGLSTGTPFADMWMRSPRMIT